MEFRNFVTSFILVTTFKIFINHNCVNSSIHNYNYNIIISRQTLTIHLRRVGRMKCIKARKGRVVKVNSWCIIWTVWHRAIAAIACTVTRKTIHLNWTWTTAHSTHLDIFHMDPIIGGSREIGRKTAEDNVSAPSSYISKAHNELCAVYTRKLRLIEKTGRPIGVAPTAASPLNLPLDSILETSGSKGESGGWLCSRK